MSSQVISKRFDGTETAWISCRNGVFQFHHRHDTTGEVTSMEISPEDAVAQGWSGPIPPMPRPNIVVAFERWATRGASLADALEQLSETTGMVVNHSVFSKWRRGERTPPPEALRYMARMVVEETLEAEGIRGLTYGSIQRIADALSPPARGGQDG